MRRNFISNFNNDGLTGTKNIYPLLGAISDGLEDEGEATKKYFDLMNVLFESHEDGTICECDYLWIKKEIEEIISEENKHSIMILDIIEKLSNIHPEDIHGSD